MEWGCLYDLIVAKKRSALFISLVRDPVSRNISAFFQNDGNWADFTVPPEKHAVDTLIKRFLEAYPHHVPLVWFDGEFQPVLGIDVYAHPFPKERGYDVIEAGNFKVLLLKVELDDAVKERAISEFLGVPDFRLIRHNVGVKKETAALYKAFKDQFVLPAALADQIYEARYTRHFYTSEEIEHMRARWTHSLGQKH